MRKNKNKMMVLAGASALAISQLTGCSTVTEKVKDRFIIEETVPVETTVAFGYAEEIETELETEEVEEAVEEGRQVDNSGSLDKIMNDLGVVTKLGKTEEENLVFNMKESLDKYAVDDTLIVVQEEEIYPENVDVKDKEKSSAKSKKDTEEEVVEEEPKEPVEVEIIYHEIGNDNSKLVEIENELLAMGYTLNGVLATQYFNDYEYETFLGDNFQIILDDINNNLGYNTTKIGAILTKLNSLTSDKTKYVNFVLNYTLGEDSPNNISVIVDADFNNNKLLSIEYGMFNSDLDSLNKFTFTSENLIWGDVISDIPSEEVFYDGLYEGSVYTYEMQREVVPEETVEDSEEEKVKSSESSDEETGVEMETVNKVSTINLKKYVSEEAQKFIDTKVITKGTMDDNVLEEKIDYLGEVSINNKPLDLNNILKSKDFSVAMSNMELYKCEPYKVVTYTSFENYKEHEVTSFDDVKDIYNQCKNLGQFTRCNLMVYSIAPGDLTLVYELNNIDGELNYVDLTVYRGKFESEEVVEELTDYVRLADRVVEDGESESTSKKNSEESDVDYKFITKTMKENLIKTSVDKESGVKYTTDRIDASAISIENISDGLEKTENGYVGNGQKYKVEVEVDSNSEILSYSIGRYWK